MGSLREEMLADIEHEPVPAYPVEDLELAIAQASDTCLQMRKILDMRRRGEIVGYNKGCALIERMGEFENVDDWLEQMRTVTNKFKEQRKRSKRK